MPGRGHGRGRGRNDGGGVHGEAPDAAGPDHGMPERGHSEESPGHLKRAAGAQSARDYAPGRIGRAGRPGDPGSGDDGNGDEPRPG